MTRRRAIVFGAVALVAVGASGYAARTWYSGRQTAARGDTTRAPQGQRIVVEVMNASGTGGLARRATFLLRDRGFDVVWWGNDPTGRRAETLVIDYTNKPEAAERLSKVLGGARIESGRDSLERGLDLTVKLGTGFVLPPEVFHP